VKVIPQPGARWLLRDGGRCYAVPASLGRRLRDGEVVPGLDEALAEGDGPAGGRTLWLGLPLLPAGVVAGVGRVLSRLTSWWWLCVLAALGCVGYAMSGRASPVGHDWPLLIAGLFAAGLVHEFGHAAALTYGGGRPGAVGVGMLFIFPVLFCDVTAVSLLSRLDRVRVDVAGVAWHLAVGGGMALAGVGLDAPSLTLASWGVLAAVVWSLLPFLRTDGYWLLCDLLGMSALEGAAPEGAGRWLRLVLIAWRVGSVLFLGVIVMALVGRLWWLVGVAEVWRGEVRWGVLVLVGGVVGVVVFNLLRRGRAMVISLWSSDLDA